MSDAFIGLGSNLGDRCNNLKCGLQQLSAIPGIRLRQLSAFRQTAPVGGPNQGNYLNAVARLETDLTPFQVLAKLHLIESRCGRVREDINGPRTLDLDLLWQGGQSVAHDALSLPHPRIQERRFVLEPLVELAPRLPLAGGSATMCLQALDNCKS